MTDKEINIAIAEACGWRIAEPDDQLEHEPWPGSSIGPKATLERATNRFRLCIGKKFISSFPWSNFGKAEMLRPTLANCSAQLPNYTTDLNAMHEAENTLNPELFTIYDDRINQAVFDECGPHFAKDGDPYKILNRWKFHATARQRAEALLKTIGKWKD